MYSFKSSDTLSDFQKFIYDIYATSDDRLYSIWDLLVQQQRFTMRALKGIRKGDIEKTKYNLLISFSWLVAIANRLHIDLEEEVWRRFPGVCSYCGYKPCVCKSIKPKTRLKLKVNNDQKPTTLAASQKLFNEIYPAGNRTLSEVGVHLAEEMGEVSEAVHNYLGQHLEKQFDEIRLEVADYVSCVFGLANSAGLDISQELAKIFDNNCHVCHKAPCLCKFTEVVQIKS